MISPDTKLSDISLGELLSCIKECFFPESDTHQSRKIKGIKGLAEYLHCSLRTAQELKSSGRIDKAIIQSGRTIIIDEQILTKLLRVR